MFVQIRGVYDWCSFLFASEVAWEFESQIHACLLEEGRAGTQTTRVLSESYPYATDPC